MRYIIKPDGLDELQLPTSENVIAASKTGASISLNNKQINFIDALNYHWIYHLSTKIWMRKYTNGKIVVDPYIAYPTFTADDDLVILDQSIFDAIMIPD